MSMLTKVAITSIFIALASCTEYCAPNDCPTATLAIGELKPVTDAISAFENRTATSELSEILGQSLPIELSDSARIEASPNNRNDQFSLVLSEERLGLVFFDGSEFNGSPRLLFGYISDWGRDTCVWKDDASGWNCERH